MDKTGNSTILIYTVIIQQHTFSHVMLQNFFFMNYPLHYYAEQTSDEDYATMYKCNNPQNYFDTVQAQGMFTPYCYIVMQGSYLTGRFNLVSYAQIDHCYFIDLVYRQVIQTRYNTCSPDCFLVHPDGIC